MCIYTYLCMRLTVGQVNKTKQELIDACTSTSIAKGFDFSAPAKDLETCVDEARENFVALLKVGFTNCR